MGIDTGCCHGGKLTAIEIPGFIVHQVQSEKDHWKEQLQHWQLIVLQNKPWLTMNFMAIDKLLLQLRIADREDVREYLSQVRKWRENQDKLLTKIIDGLADLVKELMSKHPDDFNQVASGYFFKTFLFKTKSNKLTVEDLEKSLDSPDKRMELARELAIPMDDFLLRAVE